MKIKCKFIKLKNQIKRTILKKKTKAYGICHIKDNLG